MSRSSSNDDLDFNQAMKGVSRLKHDKVELNKPRKPAQLLVQPKSDNSSVNNLAIGLENIPEQTGDWFHQGLQRKRIARLKKGQFDIENRLDLHGYNRVEALQECQQWIEECHRYELQNLLLVHGRGLRSSSGAVLKPILYQWLTDQKEVLAVCKAQPKDGGDGASYIYLSTKR